MLAQLPPEALVVISMLIAAMVFCCLKVMGSEIERETTLRILTIKARRVYNERYERVLETRRTEAERRSRLLRKPWADDPVDEADVVEAVEIEDEPATAIAA